MPLDSGAVDRPGADGARARLQAAFELSPIVLCVTGLADGRIRDVNDAFLRVTGYRRDEVIGRSVADLGLWADPALRERGLEALRAGRQIRDLEARFRRKDGRELVAVVAAGVVTIDGEACVLTAGMDITDRVRAEEALRESERRFMLAFHANPLPMSITSLPEGRHLEVNEAALRHSGYTREEVLGRTKLELGFWVEPEQRRRLMKLLCEQGRVRDFEVVFRTKSGERRHLLVNSEVITYGGGTAVLSVSLDITERKQMEARTRSRRRRAEAQAEALSAANRAKDEFLAMLGHELRNPLGTITNAVAVLERLAIAPDVRSVTAIIRRQAAHLTRLVDDLLDVARVTSGKIVLRTAPVDLREIAARCLDALAQAGRTGDHRVTLEGEPGPVEGDAARLEQVVNNLVDNALKYTPAGGAITVTTGREGGDAVLRVRDTGPGIPPDVLDRVFELFVQEPQALDRARGGLGLGLTLVKRLCELHGGTVSARSAGPGQGSEFTVRLPALRPAPAGEPAAAAAVADGAGPPRRVLVVEDGADARESLRLLLALDGHAVAMAEDGPGGLALLRSFRPDVALIDLGLPGMDGFEVARAARGEARAPLLLVALTGYGQEDDRHRALEAGFDMHVTKPVDPALLRHILRAAPAPGAGERAAGAP